MSIIKKLVDSLLPKRAEEIRKSNFVYFVAAKISRFKHGEPIHFVGEDNSSAREDKYMAKVKERFAKREKENQQCFEESFGISVDYVVKVLLKTQDVYSVWDQKFNIVQPELSRSRSEQQSWERDRWSDIVKTIPEAIKLKQEEKINAKQEAIRKAEEEERKMRERIIKNREAELQIEKDRMALSEGGIYIMSNPSMPSLVKIGFTKRYPDKRSKELYNHTGVPEPFKLEAFIPCSNPFETEQKVHKILSKYRINDDREFFEVSIAFATKAIVSAISGSTT